MLLFNTVLVSGSFGVTDCGIGKDCHCITTRIYDPVCASNGCSYTNTARLNCAKRCLNNTGEINYFLQDLVKNDKILRDKSDNE